MKPIRSVRHLVETHNTEDDLEQKVLQIKPRLEFLDKMEDLNSYVKDPNISAQIKKERRDITDQINAMTRFYGISLFDIYAKLGAENIKNQLLRDREEIKKREQVGLETEVYDLVDENQMLIQRMRRIDYEQRLREGEIPPGLQLLPKGSVQSQQQIDQSREKQQVLDENRQAFAQNEQQRVQQREEEQLQRLRQAIVDLMVGKRQQRQVQEEEQKQVQQDQQQIQQQRQQQKIEKRVKKEEKKEEQKIQDDVTQSFQQAQKLRDVVEKEVGKQQAQRFGQPIASKQQIKEYELKQQQEEMKQKAKQDVKEEIKEEFKGEQFSEAPTEQMVDSAKKKLQQYLGEKTVSQFGDDFDEIVDTFGEIKSIEQTLQKTLQIPDLKIQNGVISSVNSKVKLNKQNMMKMINLLETSPFTDEQKYDMQFQLFKQYGIDNQKLRTKVAFDAELENILKKTREKGEEAGKWGRPKKIVQKP